MVAVLRCWCCSDRPCGECRGDTIREALWRLVQAVFTVAAAMDKGLELEIVNSSTDQHVHIGVVPDSCPDRLEVRAE